MILSEDQEKALISVRLLQREFPDGGGVGVISGYAGTGKTTLLGVLAEQDEGMLVVTPTGKAAVRAREAGVRAKTIHSWAYEVVEDEETGKLSWGFKADVEKPGTGYLVVDEASMVGVQTFKDLYTLCKRLNLNLILVGDGFQLPPVETDPLKKNFSVFSADFPANFKVTLNTIHRQALDSPIIRASMEIRKGRWVQEALEVFDFIPDDDLTESALSVWESGGATICHRNATRHEINRNIRKNLGYPAEGLMEGEPILVIKNNYKTELYNGEVVDVRSVPTPINTAPHAVRDRYTNCSTYVNFLSFSVISPAAGEGKVYVADREVFGTLDQVGPHVVRREGRSLVNKIWRKKEDRPDFLHANLGYCLTCHKSQGSEFPEVLVVIEDSLRLNSTDGRRWLYTAITRAKKKVSLCWRT